MHVHAGRVEGVVMICLPNTHNRNVAISNIVRLDPPSQGVNFDKVQAISLDAGLTDVTAHFAGVEQVSVPQHVSAWLAEQTSNALYGIYLQCLWMTGSVTLSCI